MKLPNDWQRHVLMVRLFYWYKRLRLSLRRWCWRCYLTQRGGWPGRTDWSRSPISSLPTAELTEILLSNSNTLYHVCFLDQLGGSNYIWVRFSFLSSPGRDSSPCQMSIPGREWLGSQSLGTNSVSSQWLCCFYQQYKWYNICVTGLTLPTWQGQI